MNVCIYVSQKYYVFLNLKTVHRTRWPQCVCVSPNYNNKNTKQVFHAMRSTQKYIIDRVSCSLTARSSCGLPLQSPPARSSPSCKNKCLVIFSSFGLFLEVYWLLCAVLVALQKGSHNGIIIFFFSPRVCVCFVCLKKTFSLPYGRLSQFVRNRALCVSAPLINFAARHTKMEIYIWLWTFFYNF